MRLKKGRYWEVGYSLDLKQRALELVAQGKGKQEVARVMGIARTSLYRWLKKQALGESLSAKRRGHFIRKLDPEALKVYVANHPDKTLSELKAQFGCNVSAIWYRLKQLKITLKKSHLLSRTRSRGSGAVY
jgi:transposase